MSISTSPHCHPDDRKYLSKIDASFLSMTRERREQSSLLTDFFATLDCHVVPPRNDARRGMVTDSVRLLLLSSHALITDNRSLITDINSVPHPNPDSSIHMTKVEQLKELYPHCGVPPRRLASYGAEFFLINNSHSSSLAYTPLVEGQGEVSFRNYIKTLLKL